MKLKDFSWLISLIGNSWLISLIGSWLISLIGKDTKVIIVTNNGPDSRTRLSKVTLNHIGLLTFKYMYIKNDIHDQVFYEMSKL